MRMRKEKGITLIVLVISIIVLLILSSIVISIITGQDGLFSKANSSATMYVDESIKEGVKINSLINSMNGDYNLINTSINNNNSVQDKRIFSSTIYTGTVVTNDMPASNSTALVNTITIPESGKYIINYVGRLSKWLANSAIGLYITLNSVEHIGGNMYTNNAAYNNPFINATVIANLEKDDIINIQIYQYQNGAKKENNLIENNLQLIKLDSTNEQMYSPIIYTGTVVTNNMPASNNSSTVNRITISETGKYLVNYIGRLEKWLDNSAIRVYLKNGSGENIGGNTYANILRYNGTFINSTNILELNKDDVLEIEIYQYQNGKAGENNLEKNELQLLKLDESDNTQAETIYSPTIYTGTVLTNDMPAPSNSNQLNTITITEAGKYIVNYVAQLSKWLANSSIGLYLTKQGTTHIAGNMYSNNLAFNSPFIKATTILNLQKDDTITATLYQHNNGNAGVNNLTRNELKLIRIGDYEL